jgi:hypothetical protein
VKLVSLGALLMEQGPLAFMIVMQSLDGRVTMRMVLPVLRDMDMN